MLFRAMKCLRILFEWTTALLLMSYSSLKSPLTGFLKKVKCVVDTVCLRWGWARAAMMFACESCRWHFN